MRSWLAIVCAMALWGTANVAWTAPPTTAGLVLDLDGSTLGSVNSSIPIWIDQANGYVAGDNAQSPTQSNGSNQPTVRSVATPNGAIVKVADFDKVSGQQDMLRYSTSGGLNGAVDAPYNSLKQTTVFTVYSVDTLAASNSTNDNSIFQLGYSNNTNNLNNDTQPLGVLAVSDGGSNQAARHVISGSIDNNGFSTATWVITASRWNGQSTADAVSGLAALTAQTAAYKSDGAGGLIGVTANGAASMSPGNLSNITIGASAASGPTRYMDGQVAEVLVYNDALSDGDYNSVLTYLQQKYLIAPSRNLYWNSTSSMDFTPSGTANFYNAFTGTNSAFSQGDEITFNDDTVGAQTTVTLTTAVRPTTATFDSTANSYVLIGGGKLSGATTLYKTGGSTLTVLTNNDYSGGTFIDGGTLQIGQAAAVSGSFGTGDVVNNGSLVLARMDGLAIPNAISGTGSLAVSGPGKFVLSAANPYSGGTQINAGTLQVAHAGALGSGAVTLNGGKLSVADMASIAPQEVASGTFSLNGAPTIDTSNVLTLTTGHLSETRSAYFSTAQSVTNAAGFSADFTYSSHGGAAEGFTFLMQNNSLTALGSGTGGHGYSGIAKSLAINFYLTGGLANKVGYGTNGGTNLLSFQSLSPVSLNGANDISFHIDYFGNTVTVTAKDLVTQATTTASFASINLESLMTGSSAYVGFTGSTGTLGAYQTISNFSFYSGVSAATVSNPISVAAGASGTIEAANPYWGGKVNLSAPVTLGAGSTLNVAASGLTTNSNYSVTASNLVLSSGVSNLNVSNNGSGTGNLSLTAVSAGAGATITKGGAGALNLNGTQSYGAGTSLSATAGTVNFNTNAGTLNPGNLNVAASGAGTTLNFNVSQRLGSLQLNSGAHGNLAAAAHSPYYAPGNHHLIVSSLAITGSGVLDIADGLVAISLEGSDGPSDPTVTSMLLNGNLLSTVVNSDPNGYVGLGIMHNENIYAYVDPSNNQLLLDNLLVPNAVPIPNGPGSVLVKYTYYGDTDLNGKVDGDDLTVFFANYGQALFGWENGDFDYNGSVNGDDLTIFFAAYGAQLGDGGVGGPQLGPGTAVPEPSSLVMLLLGLGGVVEVARRRRAA